MAKILTIDDDEQILMLLKMMLTSAGHEVVQANNGKLGAQLYRQEPTDVIITDIIMPDKEGIEIIVELKKEYPDAKIIAISGGGRFGPEQFLALAKNLGAKMTVTKPFKKEQILAAIDSVLEA